jgi:hypothetical protein|tara:strand:- start:444 stop:821 length:378 start_codon:yes stop_codon:yes gene_type:complete
MKYDITHALQQLAPGAEWSLNGGEYSGLNWINGHGQDKPSEATINAKIAELDGAEAMRLLRIERDKRLAKDDWKVVKAKETGTNLSTAFKTYRQALRDLPSTATPTLSSNCELDMSSVTWPTEPS